MSRLEELIRELCPDGVEYQTIGECVQKVSNIRWADYSNAEFQYIDLTSVDRDTHRITNTQTITTDNAPSRAQQIVKTGDILLGATRPMLKRYCLCESRVETVKRGRKTAQKSRECKYVANKSHNTLLRCLRQQ